MRQEASRPLWPDLSLRMRERLQPTCRNAVHHFRRDTRQPSHCQISVLDRLQPLGVEAALAVIDARNQRRSEKRRQLELALQQARYEAARAQRQYDATDPENCLVASELERSMELAFGCRPQS